MKVYLVVLSPGKSQGKNIPVTRFPFLIGRDPSCQLRPSSGLVSGRHCALLLRDGRVFVEDLKSTNGTLVDGSPVRGEQAILGGALLAIGPLLFCVTIERRISVNDSTPMPGMPAPPDVSEDEAASILLFLGRDEKPPSGGVEFGAEDMADGTVETEVVETQKSSGDHRSKDHPPSSERAKADTDTATTADAILLQYRRRSRK
jgi:pSer/pThr/pTyr-binding forkhead associated (FHA) protein